MISNMVNFQVLILFSISSVTKFVFEIEFLISQVLTVFAAASAAAAAYASAAAAAAAAAAYAAYAVPSNDFKVNCCSD